MLRRAHSVKGRGARPSTRSTSGLSRSSGSARRGLTQRLRQLERDGLVVRTYHPEVPPRVEYEISDLGRSLGPLFAHLSEWAETNLEHVERARRRYDGSGAPRG